MAIVRSDQICLLIFSSAVPPVRGGRTEACGSHKKVFFRSERVFCEEKSVEVRRLVGPGELVQVL